MVYVHAISLVNALGSDKKTILKNWKDGVAPGLIESSSWLYDGKMALFASVKDELPNLPEEFAKDATRNNRLLAYAWEKEKERFETLLSSYKKDRVAIVLGTSTSGSEEAAIYIKNHLQGKVDADYDARAQEFGNPSEFFRRYLAVTGPAYTVSTACTSSTRAIVSAARLIESGLADAAIAGGVDTLAKSAINGFNVLEALSTTRCKPFAANRSGITIGEASGLMWLSKEPSPIFLAGFGETSDAYHISSPDPEGQGAEKAMREALSRAHIAPTDIDYINAHGTATLLNDTAEAKAVNAVFGDSTPMTSTKNLTGHTLGAAGITDAGLAALLLLEEDPQICGQFFDGDTLDEKLARIGVLQERTEIRTRFVMSNNFAFGGNNASLIFGRS